MTSTLRLYLTLLLWTIATVIVVAGLWTVAHTVAGRVPELHLFIALSLAAGLFISYLVFRWSREPRVHGEPFASHISANTKRFVTIVVLALIATAVILRPLSPYLGDLVVIGIIVFCVLYLSFQIPALVRFERQRIRREVEEATDFSAKHRPRIQ